MDTKEIVTNYLPIAIALLEIIYSLALSVRKPGYWNIRFLMAILTLNFFAIYMIMESLNNKGMTYIPHILVGLSMTIVIGQWLLNRKPN